MTVYLPTWIKYSRLRKQDNRFGKKFFRNEAIYLSLQQMIIEHRAILKLFHLWWRGGNTGRLLKPRVMNVNKSENVDVLSFHEWVIVLAQRNGNNNNSFLNHNREGKQRDVFRQRNNVSSKVKAFHLDVRALPRWQYCMDLKKNNCRTN